MCWTILAGEWCCRDEQWYFGVLLLWYYTQGIFSCLQNFCCPFVLWVKCSGELSRGHWTKSECRQCTKVWIFLVLLLSFSVGWYSLSTAHGCSMGGGAIWWVGGWYTLISVWLRFWFADMASICQWWGVHSNISAAFRLCHITCICTPGKDVVFPCLNCVVIYWHGATVLYDLAFICWYFSQILFSEMLIVSEQNWTLENLRSWRGFVLTMCCLDGLWLFNAKMRNLSLTSMSSWEQYYGL
jgi:hypothetical protein